MLYFQAVISSMTSGHHFRYSRFMESILAVTPLSALAQKARPSEFYAFDCVRFASILFYGGVRQSGWPPSEIDRERSCIPAEHTTVLPSLLLLPLVTPLVVHSPPLCLIHLQLIPQLRARINLWTYRLFHRELAAVACCALKLEARERETPQSNVLYTFTCRSRAFRTDLSGIFNFPAIRGTCLPGCE